MLTYKLQRKFETRISYCSDSLNISMVRSNLNYGVSLVPTVGYFNIRSERITDIKGARIRILVYEAFNYSLSFRHIVDLTYMIQC